MLSINIFDIDSQNNDVPLLTLQDGEHILGRGCFSNCTDKRISRNHIVIKIEDNKATLKSVHVNPCYFMSFNRSTVQLLTKNLPVELNDGDKFAFVTDIWYRIKVITHNESIPTLNGGSTVTIPVLCDDSTATLVASSSDIRTSDSTLIMKRSLEELKSSEGRKKLKTMHESLDNLLQNIEEIRNQDYVNKSGTENTKVDKDVGDDGEVTREVFRKKEISDSDDDSDVDMTAEVTRDTAVVTSVQTSKSEDKEKVSSDSDDENIQTNDEPDSSNVQEDVKDELPVLSSEANKTNGAPSESAVNTDTNDDDTRDGVNGPPSNMGPEDNEAARKEERGDAVHSCSSVSDNSIGNKLRREQCWYGASCYRKNPRHKEDVSHPGDADYDPDPNDDRPECSYGASCYRNNLMHRRQYRHPASRRAPKPSKNGSLKIINFMGCRYCKHCNPDYDHDDSAKGGGTDHGGVL